GVFARINHGAVGEQSAEEKRRQNVPGIDAGGGGGGKERRSGKRRQRIAEDKDRGRPDRERKLAADVSQIFVLAAIDDFRSELWDVGGQDVATQGGSCHTDKDRDP